MLITEIGTANVDNKITLDFERNDKCTLLIRRLKAHHRGTYLHSARVSLYTLLLAAAMDLNEQQQEVIYRSAWLHDIGKLNVPRLMLDHGQVSQDGSVSLEHCEVGKQIAKQWGDDSWVDTDMIQYHHENLDGTGHYGLSWEQLNLQTRIIRVTDSYDKMTKPSINGDGHTMEEAFEELFRWSDMMYDLSVVEQFYKLIKKSSATILLPHSK